MDFPPKSMRRAALSKIASLSSTSASSGDAQHDLGKLEELCTTNVSRSSGFFNGMLGGTYSTAAVPMNIRELDVLLALCQAAPSIRSYESAQKLLLKICPYLLECHKQSLKPSVFLRDIKPSPWEALSKNVSSAILALGQRFPKLRSVSFDCISRYIDNCSQVASSVLTPQDLAESIEEAEAEHNAITLATVNVSLLGFMEAAASYADFWSAEERIVIIERIRNVFSENFLVHVEAGLSIIRNSDASQRGLREWKRYARHYATIGRPLGAMLLQDGLMRFVVACTSLFVTDAATLRQKTSLDVLSSHRRSPVDIANPFPEGMAFSIEPLVEILNQEMNLLEDGADFLRLGSTWQQRLGFAVKAHVLSSYVNCAMVDDELADPEVLMEWLDETIADPVQMADSVLSTVVLKSMAVIANLSSSFASTLSKSLPRFIVQGGSRTEIVEIASQSLSQVLQLLSQDAIISTLYTLGNVLSPGSAGDRLTVGGNTPNGSTRDQKAQIEKETTGSAISLTLGGEEETSVVYQNVIKSIVVVAINCKDEKITALAQTILIQKVGKLRATVDAHILVEAAPLGISGGLSEFKSLLKSYARIIHESVVRNDETTSDAILQAYNHLSKVLHPKSTFFETYMIHLLESLISKGDVHEGHNSHQSDVELAAREITYLLQPLAVLMSKDPFKGEGEIEDEMCSLFRDAWFNMIVHGISPFAGIGGQYHTELGIIASNARPLIAEDRADQLESDVELNSVLRRGMNPQNTAEQKKRLMGLLPSRESEVRGLNYPKVIFSISAFLMEVLRADYGDCTKTLTYFLDPSLRVGDMGSCMMAICEEVLSVYLQRALQGNRYDFSASYVAKQLAILFTGCCHRIQRVQQAAALFADRLIAEIPSALCQKSSLFALLELLSIMWNSCLDAETDEYEWKSSFSSKRGKVSVELSDNYAFRKATLNALYKRARGWVVRVMNIAPLDVKGLLQTYLSEYDDDGAYGHVALGRSFALEMGSMIPASDQRLGALDVHGDTNINTASDFIAQYTTRQEYRYADALPDHDQEWMNFMQIEDRPGSRVSRQGTEVEDANSVLANLDTRIASKKYVPISELRDVLRRAAALLCRSKSDQSAIAHQLVGIPFSVFTKQSIKLGISLWMGVINENPLMEPRILTEIAENWERTVRLKIGVFNPKFHHSDPFYLKEEFAPSNKQSLWKRQQAALNVISPHLRILQFLNSHFNANRLGSVHIQHIYHRIIRITLEGLKHSSGHPLTREIHFQIVLFGFRVLRFSSGLEASAHSKLHEDIISAALSWFSHPPRWSFGGNRLHIKAESHLLADVETAVRTTLISAPAPTVAQKTLRAKQDLLLLLLESEQTRLIVWLFPLDHEKKQYFSSGHGGKGPSEAIISPLLRTAWAENPSLAVHLISRFQAPRLASDIRWLLLNFPEKAIDEPDALQILLGPTLPEDISFQLKYLLYWAPVNPITAVTYFLPTYKNNPFVLQYAMRALESHAIDITFFYVPQIVQALRYDILGYVERYIIETGKFSQLFAHQIIWNMKANAYKDEDSEIPDSIKPILDRVMNRLVTSFSGPDILFYEREFGFFNEITDISGKLRPFIKASKPEKKQKIEEELRKIKVEIGVYLPSNPDGVVIGIDRKSGKPLQSHAKAPYMATFRIQKNKGDMEGTENLLEKSNRNGPVPEENTIEVWQSAIFKVGDDCRQDVLALQMIAAFRGIFNNVGLDVFVYPYRVTATAPGCGVIDVLPNSISRDMLGREAVNGLYDYFVSKYGGEDSPQFQEARNNFVKSMSAYSVISYLLQFKDRHNGNIMIDDAGHILHIDFGFCFDIAPGGVKFERAPFKLTGEMVAVMGGNTESQSYHWFEELCIKAFLASRQYCEKLVHLVILMLDSGLPCFKPETIQHFRERFVLDKSEREAAEFMRMLIRKSEGSYSTTGYDRFQLLTNGIPY